MNLLDYEVLKKELIGESMSNLIYVCDLEQNFSGSMGKWEKEYLNHLKGTFNERTI